MMAPESDHEVFVGTDGDREYLLTVFNDGTRTIATRDDAHGTWSAPVELGTPAEVTC